MRESHQVRVGIFVFAGVFLAMIIIFLLGGEKQLFKRQYSLTAYFADISGLRVGAQVQLAGVNVGFVEKIAFSQILGEKKVESRLSINREYQERICRDSIASINTQGLLGDKIVAISLGSSEEEVLKDGEIISSEERPSLFTIAEKGGAIMENINNAAKSISRILEPMDKGGVGKNFAEIASELRTASKEIREITQKINRGEGTIGALVTDPSLYEDVRRLFGKLERNRLLRSIIRSRIRDQNLQNTSKE